MKLASERGILRYLASESECGGVEKPPCSRLLVTLKARLFPFVENIVDALKVDDPAAIHLQHCVVGLLIGD